MAYLDALRVFVRAYELGSMSAAGRDQRVSPAVVSARIAELERRLNARLFNRTTRMLQPTEQGRIFYAGAMKILDAVAEAEAAVADVSLNPRGSLLVAAPLGIGRRLIAPQIPEFKARWPEIDVRLRLTDRRIDVMGEGLDVAFFLGRPEDSGLRQRVVLDCERALCAAPEYIARRGMPRRGEDLAAHNHDCLMLRFPGAQEIGWLLETEEGERAFPLSGPFESDDGDVLTDWALAGHGIVNKPLFEVAAHLRAGRLVKVAEQTPPAPVRLVCLYPHKRHQDAKSRLFIDFMTAACRSALDAVLTPPKA
ncbi:LysR family transcriptional regulator [Rhodovulum sp. DZ06]|uniref:LysR family transcriptional regulator n=1 Tax=Rhodovulum sp. DZ06 TaxID=3425126 RepID=UPI003D32AFE1